MKINRSSFTSQILILMMAAVVVLLMIQAAHSQTIAQANSRNTFQSQNNQGQVLQINMPQKSLGERLWDNTSLSYYQQFLGPTPSGSSNETYNVFQEATDIPNTGRAPLQSFHAVNLRHQINTDWAVGATLSATNGYTKAVTNRNPENGQDLAPNRPDVEFFNARAYVALPPMRTGFGTFFTTLSYEAPTSEISKDNEMRYGWVAAQTLAFNLPDVRWNAGVMGQIYRMYHKNNVQIPKKQCETCVPQPIALQTMIVSGGPYVNYRFSDKWMLGSVLTFDWDQRGVQSGSRDFNNNLPHRGRVNLTYFPQKIKYLQSVGLFSQALLKYSNETTAFGADFSVRF